MRLNNVDKSKKTATFSANNEEELDLLNESLDIVLAKRRHDVVVEKNDPVEVKRLMRATRAKTRTVDLQKVKKIKEDKDKKRRLGIAVVEEESPASDSQEFVPQEQQEVNVQDVFVVVDAINEHIASLEDNGTFKNVNKEKYQKLTKLLDNAQQLKASFERETPKPKGFGKLRK
jgi:hypothetical protein